ncbi:MAG: ThiF family adenylyltransferase [Bacilli bacterium]|nr:ThiF family adenylyltransferase [Bacilli bacterium]
MYDRLKGLFGDKLDFLAKKNILLVGVGGVGSSVFEVLIRSGIKNITIIDFDKYELSNINRQLNSNIEVIGKNKVDVLKEHANKINPDIKVESLITFLDENTNIDIKKYDYIIDACDSIKAKVLLVLACKKYNKKLICSLGVGNRVNPKSLEITTLKKTVNDPLGKKFRHELNKEGFNDEVVVLSSKEVPIKSNPVSSYIGVSMTAGILIADYVIKDLIS